MASMVDIGQSFIHKDTGHPCIVTKRLDVDTDGDVRYTIVHFGLVQTTYIKVKERVIQESISATKKPKKTSKIVR